MQKERIMFCPLSSGSSGNSAVCGFGPGFDNALIDIGLSCARIVEKLKVLNMRAADIKAVFISHEHTDHCAGAALFSKRFNVPVYASRGAWDALDANEQTEALPARNRKTFAYDEKIVLNDAFGVLPFKIPHDAAEPCGFNIFLNDKKISVVTDFGVQTDTILEHIANSDCLLIESNHDLNLLKNGKYPYILKKRILGDYGHLSNVACAETLAKVYSKRLKHVFLGHLSAQNNTPSLAYETVADFLYEKHIRAQKDFAFSVADRLSVSRAAYIL